MHSKNSIKNTTDETCQCISLCLGDPLRILVNVGIPICIADRQTSFLSFERSHEANHALENAGPRNSLTMTFVRGQQVNTTAV